MARDESGEAPRWWIVFCFFVPLGIVIWVGGLSFCYFLLTISGLIGGA